MCPLPHLHHLLLHLRWSTIKLKFSNNCRFVRLLRSSWSTSNLQPTRTSVGDFKSKTCHTDAKPPPRNQSRDDPVSPRQRQLLLFGMLLQKLRIPLSLRHCSPLLVVVQHVSLLAPC